MKPKFLFPYWTRYLGGLLVFAHIPVMLIGKYYGFKDDHSTQTRCLITGT